MKRRELIMLVGGVAVARCVRAPVGCISATLKQRERRKQ
jgi:hypothetical protein